MPLRLLLIAFFLASLMCLSGYILADRSLIIKGEVKDSHGNPLPGARIEIHETGHTTVTDTSGNFELTGLSRGNYHVHVYMPGFASSAETVTLRESNVFISFRLRSSVLEIDEVVIESKTYKLEDREKSLSVELVDRETMQKHRKTSFAESLERKPGMRTVSTGPGIAKPMLRGLSFHRIAVVDRGIKQEGQQWGADHGLEIDPYDADEVEVIKGPNTILYGSDASGGVINIRSPEYPAKNVLRGSLTLHGASNNDLLGGSAMIEGNKNDMVYRMRFSRQDYGDFRVPAEQFNYGGYILDINDNRLKNTAGRDETFTGSVGLQRDWGRSTLTISHFSQEAGLFPGAFGEPGNFSLDHEGEHRSIDLPRQVTNHTKVISNNRFLISDHWLDLDIGYQRNHRREEAEPHAHDNRPLPESINHLELILQTVSANARYYHHHTDSWRGIYGASGSFHHNEAGGFEFLIPDHEGWDAGVFSYQHYRFNDHLTLNAGLRYDYGALESRAFYEPEYNQQGEETGTLQRAPHINRNFSNVTGAAGLSYYPGDRLNLKTNFARHFRIPRAPELASNGFHHGTFRHEQGSEELNAEKGYQWDVSATYKQHNYLVSLTPFVNYYENYIYLRPTYRFSRLPGGGQVWQYEENSAFMWGGELVTEYHPVDALHLEAGMDYVWSKNLDSRLPLPLTPPASLYLEGAYTFDIDRESLSGTYLNLNMRALADQERVDRNERPTDGSVIFNLTTGTTVSPSDDWDLKLYFRIQNLLDTEYKNHLNYYRMLNLPEPGRSYSLTLEIPFRTSH